ncbi:ABC transporter ATP-binding protein [Streptomyces sp. NPDC097619]|uniref:ABC transporter ATP-binding protein n=1 Tax=Streptomyces sp. NPDC097619 TaxID=3157228 RepID=UPI00331CCA49
MSRRGARPARSGRRPGERVGWPALLALALTASSLASLALPAVLATAVDRALTEGATAALAPLALALALLTAAEALAQYAGPRGTAGTAAALRAALVRHVLAGGPHAPARPATGDLLARLTAATAEAALAAQAVVHAAAQLLMALGAVTALWLLDPRLAAAFLITAPLGYLLLRRHLTRTTRRGTGYQEAQAAVAARLLDALAGVRTIAASGTVEQEIERVLEPVPELSAHGRALWDSQRRVAWSTGLLAPATQLVVLAVAGHALTRGTLTPGALVAALGYTALGLGGFGTAQSLLDLARARAGRARVRELLAVPPPPAGLRALPPGPGRLELRAVAVHREGTPLLDSIELTVPAGRCLAVVGSSGAGSSLLAAVAGGLLAPDRGVVLLDGVPLDEVRPADLSAAVAHAFADPALTGSTLLDALRTGTPRPSAGRARAAAVTAEADGFIRRLPAGYGTALAEAPLSGGQRQRVGLARALAREGRLLVLDDATSSLDPGTEARVLRSLAAGDARRTRVVVTHRAAVAARADTVAWLDRGRLRACAPHHELWERPAYRALFHAGPGPETATESATGADTESAADTETEGDADAGEGGGRSAPPAAS